ncbi:MAG: hypothetical protein A2506_11375 [Elusimicrobia bacterium RIFOXYD12_FULL_66_9]|nr:MAG: hypothetical protein A2506_11375 [Elusimicrobia bacterium RIFOXYD12_FULL_66_9]
MDEALEQRLARLEERLTALESHKPAAPARPGTPTRIEFRPPAPSAPIDWEALAGVWFNRVGILALVLGVAFFLKYAFEHRWLNETARVILGLLSGIVMTATGDRLCRTGPRAYGQSLVGGGLSILYLSLYGAYGYYHLIGQSEAFAAMALVTAAACALAVRQDALPIAVVGLLGGFLTPKLLSTGVVNVHGLFGYLSILNVGLVGVAYFKGWRALGLGALALTQLYVQGYVSTSLYSSEHLGWMLYYATSYWLLFMAASVAHYFHARVPSRQEDVGLAALNAATFFWTVYQLLRADHHAWLGGLSLAVGGVYAALAAAVGRCEPRERNLILSHLGLAVVFLTLAIPIQFDLEWITVGWAVEAAMLFAAGFKLDHRESRFMGAGVLLTAIVRVMVVDSAHSSQHFLFNQRGLAYAFVLGAITVCVSGYRSLNDPHPQEKDFRTFFGVAGVLLGLLFLSLEGRDFWQNLSAESKLAWFGADYVGQKNLRIAKSFSLSAVWGLYGFAWFAYGAWQQRRPIRLLALLILLLTVAKVFLIDLSFLEAVWRILSFMGLGALTLAVSYYYQNARKLA